jgi:hypothetical protein
VHKKAEKRAKVVSTQEEDSDEELSDMEFTAHVQGTQIFFYIFRYFLGSVATPGPH